MAWWIAAFFIFALLSRAVMFLPTPVWRALFALPFFVTFFEAMRSFLESQWTFPRNGLSDFFACIAMGIGFCVSVYAGAYFSKEDSKKFFPLLFFFAGSMLGILWMDNIYAFFTFWEATGVSSFLLIAFHYKDHDTRLSARQAFLINTAGGLSLLTALLIMSQMTGSTSLREILVSGVENLQGNTVLALLIVFAAMTKSAQFPFHFWLPNAMKAPTPASCYLHSATMVKLGAFLLARFTPLFEGSTLWTVLLCTVGGITSLGALLMSLFNADLKRLFAWTTVSALGSIFILVGIPYEYSWKAFFSYIFAHSCYKASLFLCVGNIDKQIGTRNIYSITNLTRRMPMTSLAIILSLGSMIGLPFNLGFIGKEYLLTSAALLKGPGTLLSVVLVCTGALSIVVAYRLLKIIFKKDSRPNKGLREAPFSMWAPALGLAAAGWISTLFLDQLNEYFLRPIVSSILLKRVDLKLQVWTGFNAGLLLSISSFILGGFLSFFFLRYIAHMEIWIRFDQQRRKKQDLIPRLAHKFTLTLQNGKLSSYLFWLLIPIGAWGTWMLFTEGAFYGVVFTKEALQTLTWIPAVLIGAGFIPLLRSSRGLIQVMGLGLVGYGVGVLFLLADAPDLAMTQMAVETVSLMIFIFCLDALEARRIYLNSRYQILRGLCAGFGFLTMLGFLSVLEEGRVSSLVSPFFEEHGPTLGRGLNIVNVILVDFRALDTMGEITVLSIVAIGTYFLFARMLIKEDLFRASPIVNTATRFFIVAFLIVSLFILMRGHDSPGGGFVGGLIYAIAIVFYSLVFGVDRSRSYLVAPPLVWIGAGLGVCFISGLLPVVYNFLPPFTAVWFTNEAALGSPILFDIGVFCVIVGVITTLSFSLNGRRST